MKRLIIRSFFIGLLVHCVGGWGWSHIYVQCLRFHPTDDFRLYELTIAQGRCFIGEITGERLMILANGWTLQTLNYKDSSEYHLDEPNSLDQPNFHLLGFAYGRSTVNLYCWIVVIPFWFPTTISAILLLLVWRKTRPKKKVERFQWK